MKNKKRRFQFPVVIEWDKDSKMYVAVVPWLKGAHTQAKTLDELEENVREVTELCMEEAERRGELEFPEFVGVHQVEVACK